MVHDHWVGISNESYAIYCTFASMLLGPTVPILNPFEKTFRKDILSTYFIISCEKDKML